MRSFLAGLRTLVLPWGAGPGTPRIVLGPDIPASLTITDVTFSAAIVWYFNATEYYFIAIGTWTVVPTKVVIKGTVDNVNGITVYEVNRPDFNEMAIGTTAFDSNHPDINYRDVQVNIESGSELHVEAGGFIVVDSAGEIVANGGGLISVDAAGLLSIVSGGGFNIDLISAPRGYRSGNATDGGTLVTTAAEAAVPAATWDEEPTFDFEPDRLYRITVDCAIFNSAATNSIARVRVRQGSATTGGTLLGFWQLTTTTANVNTSTPASFTVGTYVTNDTGSTVSTKLSLTIEQLAGAANLSLYADSTVPTVVTVEDIGAVSDQPGLAEFARSVT